MSLIFCQTLVRLRAPEKRDRHGNDVRDWSAAQELPIEGWAIDAGDTTEDNESREGTVVEYTVRRRGAPDLRDSDRLRLEGLVYEIEGAIRRQPGVTARTSHVIVLLKRAEG